MNRFRRKSTFFTVFDDLLIFEAVGINFFRVVQSSLFSEFGTRQKKESNFFSSSKIKLYAFYFFKNFLKRKVEVSQSKASIFLEASPRLTLINNEWKSSYIDKWIQYFGKNNCHIFYNSYNKGIEFQFHSSIETLDELQCIIEKEDWGLFCGIKHVLKKIETTGKLSPIEFNNVKTGFEFFFKDYLKFKSLFSKFQELKKIFIYPAYQKEAILLAARHFNIEVTELQHGIIGSDSRFYIYPKSVENFKNVSLLPTQIFVWGEYWKKQLLKGYEFSEHQISVVGDFILRKQVPKKEKQRILLISVNKYMQEEFIPFIKKQVDFISKYHKGWKVLLKLHPGDSLNNIYFEEFDEDKKVIIAEKNQTIEDCLAISKIQVGVFSMVVFEALGQVERNYIISDFSNISGQLDDFEGFQNEMIDAGIAINISKNEDLISKFYCEIDSKQVDRTPVFGKFSPNE